MDRDGGARGGEITASPDTAARRVHRRSVGRGDVLGRILGSFLTRRRGVRGDPGRQGSLRLRGQCRCDNLLHLAIGIALIAAFYSGAAAVRAVATIIGGRVRDPRDRRVLHRGRGRQTSSRSTCRDHVLHLASGAALLVAAALGQSDRRARRREGRPEPTGDRAPGSRRGPGWSPCDDAPTCRWTVPRGASTSETMLVELMAIDAREHRGDRPRRRGDEARRHGRRPGRDQALRRDVRDRLDGRDVVPAPGACRRPRHRERVGQRRGDDLARGRRPGRGRGRRQRRPQAHLERVPRVRGPRRGREAARGSRRSSPATRPSGAASARRASAGRPG